MVRDVGAELADIEEIVVNTVLVALIADTLPAGATVADGIVSKYMEEDEARQL